MLDGFHTREAQAFVRLYPLFVNDQVEGDALDVELLAQVLDLVGGEAVVFTWNGWDHAVPGVNGGTLVGKVEENESLVGQAGFGRFKRFHSPAAGTTPSVPEVYQYGFAGIGFEQGREEAVQGYLGNLSDDRGFFGGCFCGPDGKGQEGKQGGTDYDAP